MSAQVTGAAMPVAKTHPKYLHSNSTSHTWVFSAIAELVDNAYDPDVSATELWIDKAEVGAEKMVCLTVEDNGRGLDHSSLLRMLSFGYCDKAEYESRRHKPIGQYGNGFKSGSMRLAKDALVLTVCQESASVGFLSQTYHEKTGLDHICIPMIEFSLPDLDITSEGSETMLEAIQNCSPFDMESIKAELDSLRRKHRHRTGTKIVLFNLRTHNNGLLELDFKSNPEDIRNPEVHELDKSTETSQSMQNESAAYISSLRRYCSILYLKPRMKIYIRGRKVKSMLIAESLSRTEEDVFKPSWLDKPLGIKFGFIPSKAASDIDDYGIMFYHRNRLIKAFVKVGYQKKEKELGVGVVGVVHNADFLTPIHNKQDFMKDDKYNSLLSALTRKLDSYCDAKQGQSGEANALSTEVADWDWLQCDECNKWRRLPNRERGKEHPGKWFCRMNTDPTHNRCDIPEEPHLEGEFTKRTYNKVLKPQSRKRKSETTEGPEPKIGTELKGEEPAWGGVRHEPSQENCSDMQESSWSVASTRQLAGHTNRSFNRKSDRSKSARHMKRFAYGRARSLPAATMSGTGDSSCTSPLDLSRSAAVIPQGSNTQETGTSRRVSAEESGSLAAVEAVMATIDEETIVEAVLPSPMLAVPVSHNQADTPSRGMSVPVPDFPIRGPNAENFQMIMSSINTSAPEFQPECYNENTFAHNSDPLSTIVTSTQVIGRLLPSTRFSGGHSGAGLVGRHSDQNITDMSTASEAHEHSIVGEHSNQDSDSKPTKHIDSEPTEWEAKYTVLQLDFTALKQQKEKLAQEKEEILQENAKFEQEKKKMEQRKLETEKEVLALQQKVAALTNQLKEERERAAQEKREMEQNFENELSAVQSQFLCLKSQHKQAKKETEQQKETTRKEVLDLVKQIAALKAELDREKMEAKKQKRESEAKADEMERQKERAEKNDLELCRQLSSLRSNVYMLLALLIPDLDCREDQVEEVLKDLIKDNSAKRT